MEAYELVRLVVNKTVVVIGGGDVATGDSYQRYRCRQKSSKSNA
jgi:hypothetical protein